MCYFRPFVQVADATEQLAKQVSQRRFFSAA
jgi:hypothetical protein